MVLICDLDGTITYASPLASGLQLPDRGADRQAAERLRAPRGHRRRPGGDRHRDRPARGRGRGPRDDDGEVVQASDARRATAAASPAGCAPPTGSWRHVECAVLLYRVPGEPARMLLTCRDVSDQVALRQQVTHLTFHDGLTGLPNRAYVEERAREALEPSGERVAGVIFLDLDGFTAVNDLVGHGAGDLVLAQAAQAAAGRRARPGHRRALGRRRVRRADGERDRRPGDHRARRAAGRHHRGRAVPGRRAGHRADRERRRRAGRRERARRGAAQRGRGHGQGQGQRRQPGRGLRRAHARGRGAPP